MNEIDQAVTILYQGGIVIFPTDTAIGIGCRIDREDAVKRLFKIRKRAETKATPTLVSSIAMAENFLTPLPVEVKNLMRNYWPGALTIVYTCETEKVPSLVRGGTNTLGVRMPNYAASLEIIKQVGVPILGPSANFSGETTPYDTKEVDPELIKLVDYVVSGTSPLKQASTVIDCSVTPWKILRAGSIKINKLQ